MATFKRAMIHLLARMVGPINNNSQVIPQSLSRTNRSTDDLKINHRKAFNPLIGSDAHVYTGTQKENYSKWNHDFKREREELVLSDIQQSEPLKAKYIRRCKRSHTANNRSRDRNCDIIDIFSHPVLSGETIYVVPLPFRRAV